MTHVEGWTLSQEKVNTKSRVCVIVCLTQLISLPCISTWCLSCFFSQSLDSHRHSHRHTHTHTTHTSSSCRRLSVVLVMSMIHRQRRKNVPVLTSPAEKQQDIHSLLLSSPTYSVCIYRYTHTCRTGAQTHIYFTSCRFFIILFFPLSSTSLCW